MTTLEERFQWPLAFAAAALLLYLGVSPFAPREDQCLRLLPALLLAGWAALPSLSLPSSWPEPWTPHLPVWAERWMYNPRERTAHAVEALRQRDAKEARSAADTALRLAPQDPLARYNDGTAHLLTGDRRGAVPLLEQAARELSRSDASNRPRLPPPPVQPRQRPTPDRRRRRRGRGLQAGAAPGAPGGQLQAQPGARPAPARPGAEARQVASGRQPRRPPGRQGFVGQERLRRSQQAAEPVRPSRPGRGAEEAAGPAAGARRAAAEGRGRRQAPPLPRPARDERPGGRGPPPVGREPGAQPAAPAGRPELAAACRQGEGLVSGPHPLAPSPATPPALPGRGGTHSESSYVPPQKEVRDGHYAARTKPLGAILMKMSLRRFTAPLSRRFGRADGRGAGGEGPERGRDVSFWQPSGSPSASRGGLPAHGADTVVRATLEPPVIGVGEVAVFTIEVRGTGLRSLSFRPDFELENLDIVGGPNQYDDMRYGNGTLTRTFRESWQVRAREVGKARVHSLRVRLDDEVIQMQDREITVQEAPTRQADVGRRRRGGRSFRAPPRRRFFPAPAAAVAPAGRLPARRHPAAASVRRPAGALHGVSLHPRRHHLDGGAGDAHLPRLLGPRRAAAAASPHRHGGRRRPALRPRGGGAEGSLPPAPRPLCDRAGGDRRDRAVARPRLLRSALRPLRAGPLKTPPAAVDVQPLPPRRRDSPARWGR